MGGRSREEGRGGGDSSTACESFLLPLSVCVGACVCVCGYVGEARRTNALGAGGWVVLKRASHNKCRALSHRTMEFGGISHWPCLRARAHDGRAFPAGGIPKSIHRCMYIRHGSSRLLRSASRRGTFVRSSGLVSGPNSDGHSSDSPLSTALGVLAASRLPSLAWPLALQCWPEVRWPLSLASAAVANIPWSAAL